MNIAIIDYDAGNIGSLKYALTECGFEGYVAYKPQDLTKASHIILPGVGSFHKAMQVLRERNLDSAIKEAVIEKNIPILGICLGMQVLASKGYEGGETAGLDLIPGKISLLQIDPSQLRLPHIGWNEINFNKNHFLFDNIATGSDFYFLHSYHFIAQATSFAIADTFYGSKFTSVIMKNNIVGVQFHPEKSGKLGRQLLRNFVLS